MAVDDSYTKALLHMNGADASPAFTDESGKTWTRAGNAQIDTAQYKFGGASGLFDGNGDAIYAPTSVDFYTGANNFTIDFWAKVNSAGDNILFCNRSAAGTACQFYVYVSSGNIAVLGSAGTGSWDVNFTTTGVNINDGSWHHVAYVRNGNLFSIYFDGVSRGLQTVSVTLENSPNNLQIGAWYSGSSWVSSFNGWVDEFRFSNGIARWTANFTPPTTAYSSDVMPPMWFM